MKADNCAKLIQELNGSVSTLDAEIDRLEKRRDALISNAQNLKKYIESAMIATGKKKFKTDLFGFNIQKNPPSVVIDRKEDIPEEYWIAQQPKLDKTALKKWLKDNKADFAHLEQGESLRIR